MLLKVVFWALFVLLGCSAAITTFAVYSNRDSTNHQVAEEPLTPTETRKSGGADAVKAIRDRDLPELGILVERTGLSHFESWARGYSGEDFDYGNLRFAHLYRVKKEINSNRLGHLNEGDVVRFLGYYVFPYDNGLRLHLEPLDQPGVPFSLEFEGNFPETPDTVRYISTNETLEFFEDVKETHRSEDRRRDLLDAAEILRTTRTETDRLVDEANENAKSDPQKKLEALLEKHDLWWGTAYSSILRANDVPYRHSLDYKSLYYGHLYRVMSPVIGNHQTIESLASGDEVFFMGVTVGWETQTELQFERVDGEKITITYYFPELEEQLAFGPLTNPSEFWQEIPDSNYTRHKELRGIREKLLELGQHYEELNQY